MRAECAAFREVAPELALGIAVGDERATALEHLLGCDDCRRALDRLTETVDAVVQSAPEAEPPGGFEVRALASFEPAAPEAAGRSSGWKRVALAAAVIFVIAAFGAGLVTVLSGDPGGTDQSAAGQSSAVLTTPGGAAVGTVRVEQRGAAGGGWTSDLVVSVDAGAQEGTYRVECDYESGGPYRAGEVEVGADGVDEWRTTVSVPTYDLSRVRLVSTGDGDNLDAEFCA